MSPRSNPDPKFVYKRGLQNPDSLTPEERMVYLIMEIETYMDMEGWDHFFTTDNMMCYYDEFKGSLELIGDADSLEVIEDYERHLARQGIPFYPAAIDAFLCDQDDAYFANCRDWREDHNGFIETRWRKVADYLRSQNIQLLA